MTSHPPSYKLPCSCLCKEKLGDESKLIQVRTGQAQRDASIEYYPSLQPLAPEKLPEPKDGFYLLNKCSRSLLCELVQPASELRSAFRIPNILWQRAPQLITHWEEPPLPVLNLPCTSPTNFTYFQETTEDSWALFHPWSTSASLLHPLFPQTTITPSF